MAASCKDYDRIFGDWLQKLDGLTRSINVMYMHKTVFTEVRDAVVQRYPEKDGTFIVSYGDVYWDSQVMAVRRMADQHSGRPESAWWLIERIRRNRSVMSRERYVNARCTDGIQVGTRDFTDELRRAHRDFDSYGTGDVIDEAVLTAWQRELAAATADVRGHADTVVAHRDAREWSDSVTFATIHAGVHACAQTVNRLQGLLRQTDYRFDLIQLGAGWKAPCATRCSRNHPYGTAGGARRPLLLDEERVRGAAPLVTNGLQSAAGMGNRALERGTTSFEAAGTT